MTHWPGPGRSRPALVPITRSSGYGCSASPIRRSETSGPYELAVSMKFTPSSTARCSTRLHSSGSSGSPQTPSPVSRMAPKPSRWTVSSPPMSKLPAAAAIGSCVVSLMSAPLPGSTERYAWQHPGLMDSDRFTASGFPALDRAGDAERYVQYLDAQAATPFWKKAKRATIDALALPHGGTALDIGCGVGDEVRAMAAVPGAAGGVDASRTFVEEARRRTG